MRTSDTQRFIYSIVRFSILAFLILSAQLVKGQGNFSSTGSSSDWSVTTTWTLTSGTDVDNIPDADDDVTILAGHAVIVDVVSFANTLTLDNMGAPEALLSMLIFP